MNDSKRNSGWARLRGGFARRSLFLLISFLCTMTLMVGAAQAVQPPIVKISCRGPAGFTANATWTWTFRDRAFPDLIRRTSYSLVCSGTETITAYPWRPGTAFRFSLSANLTNAGISEIFGDGKIVDPGHIFHVTDRFAIADPASLSFHLTA